jgi:predicted O-methyltransferase YrrM
MKSIFRSIIEFWGYELCRLNDDERVVKSRLQAEGEFLNYKDIQLLRGATALSRGHISIDEARFLMDLVRETPSDEVIVEIGTLFGYSTLVMALAKQQGQLLITVDDYSGTRWA